MAEFNGKKGHWVTTESGEDFEEAVSDAFGKENVGKYKKHDKVKEVIDKMTENGTKEVNLNAGTISRASNGELTEEEVHKWFEENDELEDYEAFDDDNDFENWDKEEFVENIDDINYDKAEKNEKKNADKGRKSDGSLSDEAFKIGQKGAKTYLDYITQYNDLDKLKKSNIFLGGLQNAVSKAITEAGYNPNLELTYNDFNDVIGSVLGEEVDIEEYERDATKGFTGKKYRGK